MPRLLDVPGDLLTAAVSVVMITWNRRDDVMATIPRLQALPDRPPLIVVDNGSSDGTVEALAGRHPEVTVVALDENLEAAGRNIGVERTRTAYVAFSDDDSWWAPGALARAAEVLDAHPRLALLAARVVLGEGGPPDPTVEAMRHSPLPAQPDLPGPPVLGFIGCGAVVRRDAFLAVGGFSPLMGVGGEERPLAVDLAEAGWGVAYVDDVVAVHQPSPHRDIEHRRRRVVRNALWHAWLRRPLSTVVRTTAMAALAAFRDPAARDGLAAAVRGIPNIMRARRPVGAELETHLRLIDPRHDPHGRLSRAVKMLRQSPRSWGSPSACEGQGSSPASREKK